MERTSYFRPHFAVEKERSMQKYCSLLQGTLVAYIVMGINAIGRG
jgi:hypothetical protein